MSSKDEADDDYEVNDELKVRAPSRPATADFDLNTALKALSEDNISLQQKLEDQENHIRDQRASIVAASRKNFILERELNEIDEKIKLLIKNRISVQEVSIHSAGETKHENETTETSQSILKGRRHNYEDLFYLLQSKPRYLADLARLCGAKEIPLFVQTVVFDMYGDQYDTREERLLLSLFRRVLKAELDNCFTPDHQLLTVNGFVDVGDIKDGDLVASFSAEQNNFKFVPCKTIKKDGTHNTFTFRSHVSPIKDNSERTAFEQFDNIDVTVTDEHDMWVHQQNSPRKNSEWHKVKARELYAYFRDDNAAKPYADGVEDKRACVLTGVPNGIADSSTDVMQLEFVKALNLNENQVDAFLQLYGYWLRCGSMDINREDCASYVALPSMNAHTKDWLREQFAKLSLENGADYSEDDQYMANGYNVTNMRWVNYFCGEYGKKCETATHEEVLDEQNEKWYWSWYRHLGMYHCRQIMKGLILANREAHEYGSASIINTSCILFRDETIDLAIRAGYVADFSTEDEPTANNWRIRLSETHERYLKAGGEKESKYIGPVHCVSVGGDGLIIARKVFKSKLMNGRNGKPCKYATEASTPLVCGNCPDKGSLLRANTAITQMLSAYARRGQGLSILKEILEAPLKEITGRQDLNLEVNPTKVYQFIIQEEETKTGKASQMKKEVADEEAARHPLVQQVIEERVNQLMHYSNVILSRIIHGVDSIPYGMRWICKQLAELFKIRFPDSDRYQIGSVLGGYIYLRFFNPVIVTPDASHLIQTKPNRITRRNLVLIAKVLQNLSNGLLFGDKEIYMKRLNPFITEKSSPLQDYFEKLMQVDDLEDELAVDKYLEHTNVRLNLINITYNQIFLIHGLLVKHLDKVVPDKDDMIRNILQKLGAPPEEVKRDDNRTVNLKLMDRREKRMSTTANDFMDNYEIGSSRHLLNPLLLQARALLLCLLKRLPHASSHPSTSLYAFLDDERRKAQDRNEANLSDNLTNILSMLSALNNMGLLEKYSENPNDNYNMFLWKIAMESVGRVKKVSELAKRAKRIEEAYKTISNHHNYQLQRLDYYKIYLENARSGGAQAGNAMNKSMGAKVNAKELAKKKEEKVIKFNHEQLAEKGIIMKLNMDVPAAILKKCYYHFTMERPGRFRVEVHLKKGIEISLLSKPVELQLEDLLQKQEHGEQSLQIEEVTLNINLLIHLLNNNFMKGT